MGGLRAQLHCYCFSSVSVSCQALLNTAREQIRAITLLNVTMTMRSIIRIYNIWFIRATDASALTGTTSFLSPPPHPHTPTHTLLYTFSKKPKTQMATNQGCIKQP